MIQRRPGRSKACFRFEGSMHGHATTGRYAKCIWCEQIRAAHDLRRAIEKERRSQLLNHAQPIAAKPSGTGQLLTGVLTRAGAEGQQGGAQGTDRGFQVPRGAGIGSGR